MAKQSYAWLRLVACSLFALVSVAMTPHFSFAYDLAQLYKDKSDAVVVIINELNDPEEPKKDLDSEKKKPILAPMRDAWMEFANLPILRLKRVDEFGRVAHYNIGTGFFNRSDGIVVTNYHVVKDAKSITIECFDGQKFPATVVGFDSDPTNDIAVLKVQSQQKFPILVFRTTSNISVGSEIATIGHPFLLRFTLSEGIVSRIFSYNGKLIMQVHSSVLSGSSGSPVFDSDGMVVGVVYANIAKEATLGLAIPGKRADETVKKILAANGL